MAQAPPRHWAADQDARGSYAPTARIGLIGRPLVRQRFELLRELREQLAGLKGLGLGWTETIAALRGALNLAAKFGLPIPHANELLELLAIAEKFTAIEGQSEAAIRERLLLTIVAARHLANLTATEEDDDLVEVIAHFAEDDRIEKILVYVFQQVWNDTQATAPQRLLAAPRDYTLQLRWAEDRGLLRGNGLKRLGEALPQLIELFKSLSGLAGMFGVKVPTPATP